MRSSLRQGYLAPAALLAACAAEGEADGACVDCVGFETVAELDFSDAPTLPSPGGALAIRSDGRRFAFVDPVARYEILIFDDTGRFTARLGRRGNGPGEFDMIVAMAFDDQDSLWVVSQRGTRLDLFGPDLEWSRTQRLPFQVVHLARTADRMAATIGREGLGEVGFLQRDGAFDGVWQTEVPRGSGSPSGIAAIEADDSGRLWFTELYEYSIWQWDGEEISRIGVGETPDWFASAYPSEILDEFGAGLNTRGASHIDLHVDADEGRLWVVTASPSPDVRAHEVRPLWQNPMENQEELRGLLIDYVAAAFDLPSGRLLAYGDAGLVPFARSRYQYRVTSPETVAVVEPVMTRE